MDLPLTRTAWAISGVTWVASVLPEMPLGCRLRRATYATLARHKTFLLGKWRSILGHEQLTHLVRTEVLGTLAVFGWLRTWRRQVRQEKARVRDLVNSALRLLRDQVSSSSPTVVSMADGYVRNFDMCLRGTKVATVPKYRLSGV